MSQQPQQQPGAGQGQRGITPLSSKASAQRKKIIGVATFGAIGLAMVYLTLTGASDKSAQQKQSTKPPVADMPIEFKPPLPTEKSAIVPNAQLGGKKPPQLPTEIANQQHEQEKAVQVKDAAADAYKAGVEAPLLAVGGSSQAAPAASAPGVEKASLTAGQDDTPLAARLKATRLGGSSASSVGDGDYLIMAGAHIPCVLQTAMDSTVPGLTVCVVPNDILSDSGRVVLLDKGTRIIGQYQADLKQGQGRIFVVWTRAETPGRVIIDLGSPATDALGRGGFDGEVDTHFWARFGGALLLSVIDDTLSTVAAAQQKSGTTINETNTQSAASSGASTALQNTINIPPTLRKNQGEEVAVMVARDLDFHGVYSLRERAK